MTELQRLLAAYDQQAQTSQPCALATVVQVEGSAYRRPGARMLITHEGQLTGTISGGCLEGDARRRAHQVILRGKPEIVVYDSMDLDEDLEFGAQLGCQGKIHVLIEPLAYDQVNVMQLLRDTISQQEPALLTTVLTGRLNGEAITGKRLLLTGTNQLAGDEFAGELKQKILSDARVLLTESRSASTLYTIAGEDIVVFNELIHPAPQLTVFGAGNDVQPLVRMAYNMGWRVSVTDGRPNLVTQTRFPEAETVKCIKADDLPKSTINKGFAVLMSHNYFYDLEALKTLCDQPDVSYIGLLGPKKKADRLLDDLQQNGYEPEVKLMPRLHGPIGLDIGAEAAEEIAVAIMAELIAVRNGHQGGFLKNLEGPIHNNVTRHQHA